MLLELHGHWVRPNDLDAGYLLLACTIYVFWQIGRSQPLRSNALSAKGSETLWRVASGLLFLVGLVGAALAALSATKSVALGLLVAAFVPLSVSIQGTAILGRTLHGSAIVFMATPMWFVIVPGLQALTASAVNWLLQRGRWPVFVEDNLIFVPQGALEIAAGCAGLKFVQTALALTLIEGFIARRSLRAMAAIGALAFALALLCNWLRVSAITLLALYLDLQHPWVIDHNWVGWVLFVLLFGPLFFWLGRTDLGDDQSAKYSSASLQQRPTTTLLATALTLTVGFGSVWGLNQLTAGGASKSIAERQLDAAQKLCLDETLLGSRPHPAPANFSGAQYILDCAVSDQHYLSLRGYVRETQAREVINPENELLPGLGQLDFVVVNAQPKDEDSNDGKLSGDANKEAPGLFAASQVTVAYGYYAAQEWTARPSVFKLRSLMRPLYPGPVWALVVIGPANDKELEDRFNRVTKAMQ